MKILPITLFTEQVFTLTQNIEQVFTLTQNISQNEWDVTTFAVHGVYKSRGITHVRLKAGLTYAMVDQPDALKNNTWAPDENAASFSYGIGLGFETGTDKELVIEWTRISDELSILGVGINF